MTDPSRAASPDAWVLTTDDPSPASRRGDHHLAALTGYHPTFTGNGYLAARVPAAGNGFAEAPVRTQFHVVGLYTGHAGQWSRKAGLPAWSTLDVGDDSGTFNDAFLPPAWERSSEHPVGGEQWVEGDWAAVGSPAPAAAARGIARYRQTLDLRTGVISTEARWTSPAGRVTDVRYEVLTDRSRPHVAAVAVTVRPHWDGRLEVTDALDGRAATRVRNTRTGAGEGRIWLTTAAEGSGIPAALVSLLQGPAAHPYTESEDDGSVDRRVVVDVVAGHSYTFTKYVGIATGHDADDPLALARTAAEEAARAGYGRLARDNFRAWQREWEGDIVVRGDARLQRQVRAAKFYLLTSMREGSPWSPSPAGLSSDGYNGHVFWDTETWIWPSLLAQHPRIAGSALDYRVDRLDAARAYAAECGQEGARFPWESGLHGGEDTPAWAPFGRYEQHVSSDVALAFWQFWLATGDERWLREKGWPVLRGVADFWASRAVAGTDGSYHINGVIPPDEYADEPNDDSVYTNVAARASLRFATEAAVVLGEPADPRWAEVADGLVVLFDERLGVHPEFAGYAGQLIKQADVVMLAYPWENPQPDEVTRADLAYYRARTHDNGPSMTDSVHSIVHAHLGDTKAAFEHTRRSVEPFLRDPFDQFAEGRTGGAFTFLTGHGGFLQVFLYGYSGLRWRPDRVELAPILPQELDGITLQGLRWRGRSFDVDIRPDATAVRLREGDPLPVGSCGRRYRVPSGGEITIPTRPPAPAR
ncbi:glycoside hydrolase family 65 protein [Streptomyces sp. F001]|uniref:glycosyl hydrolase family 65 protein n=1 Tax=Streptomyces sp. F001 TaxID=1510026 RepID=UPI00101E3E38|nr:glycosyl hydrolase family 65 protein [Streptomyces sp. F001]RZB19349.1 glycoside hydrolase family 65 protein [Streptomyces sp. F001]